MAALPLLHLIREFVISGSNGMDASREPNGKDTHMHTVSSGDAMSP
jgi:hypothetical protein